MNDKKRCENCKKLFGPRKYADGRTEYPCLFKKKRFCSTTCSGIATQAQRKMVCAEAIQ